MSKLQKIAVVFLLIAVITGILHKTGVFYVPSITGLTAAEVEARRTAGQTNQPPKSQTKTTGEIVRDNVCTYFNLVFLVLAFGLLNLVVGGFEIYDYVIRL